MTYAILVFTYRKPGTTPEQFRDYYERRHVPLIRELTGDYFPLSHTRRYIHRAADSSESTKHNGNANYPATVILGSPIEFDYDAIAELIFEDMTHFQSFFGLTRQPENASRIVADEEIFLHRSKTRVVLLGETSITTKERL